MESLKNFFTVPMYMMLILGGKIVENKFIKLTKDAININEKTLLEIIKDNKDTAIGKKYNFNLIDNIEDFKKYMPLTEYPFYEEYIDKILNGQENILTKDKIDYLGHTSGTTGKQKLIPATKKNYTRLAKYMAVLIEKFAYNNFKDEYHFHKGAMLTDITNTCHTKNGIPICSATSGGMDKMKGILPILYTSPIEVMYIKNKDTQLYLHALFALKYRKLMYIGGVFISNVLDLFRIIEKNNKDLVNDIRRGKLKRDLDITDQTRKKLNSYLKPDSFLADTIEAEFKKGFKGIIPRLWPKFTFILSTTGANFSIYDSSVNYYTNNKPIYSPCLAATEAFIGVNPYVNKIRYILTPDTTFFEFINIKDIDKKNPKTYTLDNVQLNETYELVLTTYAGLYRYRLGDIIKVTGNYNESIEIQFLYRKNQMLNMTSEKTTESHVKDALNNLAAKEKIKLTDYTALADNSISPGHYTFYLEIKNYNKNVLSKLEKSLDEELMKANPAYKRFRDKHSLGKLEIKIVKQNTFNKIREALIKNGTSKNQIKIPRVINNNQTIIKIINNNLIS